VDQYERINLNSRFGDDSSQYEMIGGTRLIERKIKPRRGPEEQAPT